MTKNILMILAICIQNLNAQCSPPGAIPAYSDRQRSQKNVKAIVDFMKLDMGSFDRQQGKDQKTALNSATSEKDFTLVPGVRAGSVKLDKNFDELNQSENLKPSQFKLGEDYEHILTLGYSPKRDLYQGVSSDLRYAFSVPERVLKEIFVDHKKYKTVGGSKIGSSLLDVQKEFKNCGSSSVKGTTYLACNGISFLLEKNIVKTVVITTVVSGL